MSDPEIFWISLVTADKNLILFSILRFCLLVRLLNFGMTSFMTIIMRSRFCSSARFLSSMCPSSCSKAMCPVGSMCACTMFPTSAGSAAVETGIDVVNGFISLSSDVKNSVTNSFSSEANSLICPTSSAMLFRAVASSWIAISESLSGFGCVTIMVVVFCSLLFSWLKVDHSFYWAWVRKALVCFRIYTHEALVHVSLWWLGVCGG